MSALTLSTASSVASTSAVNIITGLNVLPYELLMLIIEPLHIIDVLNLCVSAYSDDSATYLQAFLVSRIKSEYLRPSYEGQYRELNSNAIICTECIPLVENMIEWGYDKFDNGLWYASRIGSIPLIKLFISKGATNLEDATIASIPKHTEVTQFLCDQGYDDYNGGMIEACAYGSEKMVNFFIEKGADNMEGGLYSSVISDSVCLAEMFIDKGAKNFFYAMYKAIHRGHTEMVNMLVRRGGENIDHIHDGLKIAKSVGDEVLIKYFEDKIATKSQ